MTDGFPLGDTSPSDAMKRARGLFRDYKQAFAPRGPGDTAGRNLAAIVDRDATPNEVAARLFGGPTGRVTGAQLETLDRLREVIGETAPAWQAVQQATMGRYLAGGDVGRRLDYLLRGEGRDLASRVLTPQQRAGLDAFRTGTVQAENARASVPDWIADLGRGGYDANRVLSDLFGSGVPGARPGQAFYGRGLKQFFGADSLECGCRGGPGYRGPSGSCVGWDALAKTCGAPPTTRCTAEQVNPRPGETKEAPAPRRESSGSRGGGAVSRPVPNPFQ